MTDNSRVAHVFLALSALLLVLAIACSSSAPTGPGSTGTLTVMLKDSPFSDAKALLVIFSEVSAHRSEGDWVTLPFAGATTRTCDLMKLMGAQDVLGIGVLPAGHYTQLRLAVASATIYTENPSAGSACAAAITAPAGKNSAVDVPSDTIKLNREFDVPTGGATTILLDFDGDKSILQTGNGRYMMQPVIGVVSVQ